jgi:hypothetical protein
MSRRSRVRAERKPRCAAPSSGERRRAAAVAVAAASRCARRPGGSRCAARGSRPLRGSVDHARVVRATAADVRRGARLPAAPPPAARSSAGGRGALRRAIGMRLPSRRRAVGTGPRSRRGSPWARRGSRSPRGTVEPADALFARTVVRGTLLRWGRSFTRALFARGALRTAGGGGFGSDGFGARPSRWNGGTMGGARELVELCRGDGRRP